MSGASVILFKENPVYRSLLEKNIIVFSEIDLQRSVSKKVNIEGNRK